MIERRSSPLDVPLLDRVGPRLRLDLELPVIPPLERPPAILPPPPGVDPFVHRGYGDQNGRPFQGGRPAFAELNTLLNDFATARGDRAARYVVPPDRDRPHERTEIEVIDQNRIVLTLHSRADGSPTREVFLATRRPGTTEWTVLTLRQNNGRLAPADFTGQLDGASNNGPAADGMRQVANTDRFPLSPRRADARGEPLDSIVAENLDELIRNNPGKTGTWVVAPDSNVHHRMEVRFVDPDHITITTYNVVGGNPLKEVAVYSRDPGGPWRVTRGMEVNGVVEQLPLADQRNGAAENGVTQLRLTRFLLHPDIYPLHRRGRAEGTEVSPELATQINTFMATHRLKTGDYIQPPDGIHRIQVKFTNGDQFEFSVTNGAERETVRFSRVPGGPWRMIRYRPDGDGVLQPLPEGDQTTGAAATGVNVIRFQRYLNNGAYPLTPRPPD